MPVQPVNPPEVNLLDSPVKQLLKRYEHARSIKDQWKGIFEECYEYALPQRESFYTCLLYTSPSPRDTA